MGDPEPNEDGTERSAFFLLCDSTHIPIQSSSNMTFQKTTFSHKGWHAIILTNLSNCEGRILLFTLASPSTSPSHNDARISGSYIFDDVLSLEDGGIIRTGLAPLLKGSKRHYVIAICDSGYEHVPTNMDLENITLMKDFIRENGGRNLLEKLESCDQLRKVKT